ncbi:MAG: hypothetical protein K9H49_17950 [Bacteroidales bacterium]|nr:hypothetical protein [Bacteroidales bacterium]MCF8391375.1 hypothetical protein [Bacteroidales bacterium]
MKAIAMALIMSLSILLINSCSTTQQTTSDSNMKFTLQIGTNFGGITENTDMSVVPNVSVPPEAIVDAFSGATHTGYNIGVHASKNLYKNQIESGIDYMCNFQTFNYIDAGNFYIGVRRLQVSQIMLPITYNFGIFRNILPNADIQFKIGFLGQLNLISVDGTGISLPDWSFNPWSNGLTFGLSAFPFQFNNGNKLGFYFDGYRGSQIYKDYYNKSSFEMPGSSFIKFGLNYQFN